MGSFILSIGSRCNQLAVAWWALEQSGSAALFATLIAYAGFAEVIAKPMFGWFGDQLDRKKIILICNVGGAFTSLALLLMALTNFFYSPLVCTLLVIFSIVAGIRDPIHSSILPMLVEKNQLTDAIRLKNIITSISLLLGPGLAGILISIFGVPLTLAVDFFAFIVAITMISIIKSDTAPTSRITSDSLSYYLKEWAGRTYDGFAAVVRIKTEFFLALLAMIINFSLFPFFTILLPVFVKSHLGFEPWFIGVLDSCFGLGILFGSGFIVKRFNALWNRDISVFVGIFLLGISLFSTGFFGYFHAPWAILPFMVLGGIGLMLININTSVLRSLATPQSYRNRMAAMVSFLSTSIGPMGAYAAGVFVAELGVVQTITILGGLIMTASFVVFVIPHFKTLMRLSEDGMENAYSRIYPNAFD
jgi:MFS family permease